MEYFLLDERNQQIGPFSVEQLKSKNISANTKVWCEGMANWADAGTIPELKPINTAPANSGANINQFLNKKENSKEDTIILIVVIWMAFNTLLWAVFPSMYYEAMPLATLLGVIGALVPLTLAFAVKDKTKQIVVFVLGGLLVLVSLVQTFFRFF
jgi:uncharacterized protein DUF4339